MFSRYFKYVLLVAASTLLSGHHICAVGQNADPIELSLEDNIEVPVVPQRDKQNVKERNDRLRTKLERAGFNTGKLRQGEVIMITIPCERLFRANATSISDSGRTLLKKLSLLDDYQTNYKMLIAVHTDDTGDTAYADNITADRANAIDDFINDELGFPAMQTIPYGIGNDEPLGPNDSIRKRAINRRVEIYLVPVTFKK